MSIQVVVLTLLALIAFAANSVFARLALGAALIDPASFTLLRLLFGMVTLIFLVQFAQKSSAVTSDPLVQNHGIRHWFSAIALFTYAICFSYAYVDLDTATGALILFSTVQLSMILVSIVSGKGLTKIECIGVLIAFAGFSYIFLPNLAAPSFCGALLMVISGIAWAAYTLLGRGSLSPLNDTAASFIKTLPGVVLLFFIVIQESHFGLQGIVYAALSGVIASGVGYAIWYSVLPKLSITQASVLQLLVPIIAAAGGILFADEQLTQRLVIASIMVLGGCYLVIVAKSRPNRQAS